jgi:hypothetical protein
MPAIAKATIAEVSFIETWDTVNKGKLNEKKII